MATVFPDFTTISRLRTPATEGEFYILEYLASNLSSDYEIFLRVLHKECYNGILQLRSSLCNTVQNVRQSGL